MVVGHNLIQEGQSLAEMFLPSLNDLSIEYWQSNFQINDLSWMAKLQPSEIARICKNGQHHRHPAQVENSQEGTDGQVAEQVPRDGHC